MQTKESTNNSEREPRTLKYFKRAQLHSQTPTYSLIPSIACLTDGLSSFARSSISMLVYRMCMSVCLCPHAVDLFVYSPCAKLLPTFRAAAVVVAGCCYCMPLVLFLCWFHCMLACLLLLCCVLYSQWLIAFEIKWIRNSKNVKP